MGSSVKNQYDQYLNKAIQELTNRDKFTKDQFFVVVKDNGKLVTVTRKQDGATHEFKRATEWPLAQEFINNLTGAQLNDLFQGRKEKKK